MFNNITVSAFVSAIISIILTYFQIKSTNKREEQLFLNEIRIKKSETLNKAINELGKFLNDYWKILTMLSLLYGNDKRAKEYSYYLKKLEIMIDRNPESLLKIKELVVFFPELIEYWEGGAQVYFEKARLNISFRINSLDEKILESECSSINIATHELSELQNELNKVVSDIVKKIKNDIK